MIGCLLFDIPIKAISLNHYRQSTFKGRGSYKTKEAKLFENRFKYFISLQQSQIDTFNELFNESKHKLSAEYLIGLPFYKKDGSIMKRKHDLDNFIKPINDQLFKHLTADDSMIVKFNAEKINVNIGDEFIRIRLMVSIL